MDPRMYPAIHYKSTKKVYTYDLENKVFAQYLSGPPKYGIVTNKGEIGNWDYLIDVSRIGTVSTDGCSTDYKCSGYSWCGQSDSIDKSIWATYN